MSVRVSVIIRSKDEAPRLRLTLASLRGQAALFEVVVVDDGSRDGTGAVVAAARELPVRAVRHESGAGRSAAANAGAALARGDVLLFLDGDTLAGPGLLAAHAAAHGRPGVAARGEVWHLRCTRWLLDPETGSPQVGAEARLAAMPSGERESLRVTVAQIRDDFAAIARRAQPGLYPGAGPRRLAELEMDALLNHPDCEVLWAAASGSNFSVPRDAFRQAGGFMESLDINEHRELALRLCDRGMRMATAPGAFTYHMTHRSGWRDPLQDLGWHAQFLAAHPIAAVRLLPRFWATIGGRAMSGAPIGSLPALAAAARAA
jgi:glycosyltransferase involved in cell wall biosynthesis